MMFSIRASYLEEPLGEAELSVEPAAPHSHVYTLLL